MSDDARRPDGAASAGAGGPEHDAWLREALRHAPDAGAAPPPSLRDAILAEARAAARAAPPRAVAPAAPSLVDRMLAFWSWLARPQVAAGFASVMAATLVGMLWWDRPIDETMLPPPTTPQATTAPRPASETPAPIGEKQARAPAGEASMARADAARAATQAPTEKTTSAAADRAPPAANDLRDAPTATATTRASSLPPTQPPAAAKTLPAPAAADAARENERRQLDSRATDALARRSQEAAKQAARVAEPMGERKDDDARGKAQTPSDLTVPAPGVAGPAAPGVARSAEAPSPFPARSRTEAEAKARSGVASLDAPPPPVIAAAPAPAAMPAPAPAPAAAATPAPAPVVPAPVPAPPRAEPFALAKKAEQGAKESAAATASRTAPATPPAAAAAPPAATLGSAREGGRGDADVAGRVAAQNAVTSASRQRSVIAASAQPLAPLLAALASPDARWLRRGAGGETAPVDAATRTWLEQVQAATASHWDVARSRRDAAGAGSAAATGVRVERDANTAFGVVLEDGGVRFEPPSGPALFAPLPADVVARLRASLPPLAR